MRSRSHTVFCLLAICASLIVSQNLKAQDFLEPDSTFIGNYKGVEYLGEYYNGLKQQLFPEEWSIGYLSVPSFSSEYGIFLIWGSNGPMLVYNVFIANYWYYRPELHGDKTQLTIYRDTIRISAEEANRLTEIMTDAIDKAVEPGNQGIMHLDGTAYYFMLPDKMAKTRSPQQKTECGKLVEEFENLKNQFPLEQRHKHAVLMLERHNIARIGLDYSTSLNNTPITSGIGPLSGTYLTLDVMYRRFYLGFEVSFPHNRVLRTDDFFYDSKEDYNWRKGKDIKCDEAVIKAGFSFIELESFRMTAFMGYGVSTICQTTNKIDNKNKSITSKTELKRIKAGAFADFRLYSFRLGPINGVELSAGIYASRDKMKSIEPSYSLNASLSLLFTFDPDI